MTIEFFRETDFRGQRPCCRFYHDGKEIVFRGPTLAGEHFFAAWETILRDEANRYVRGKTDRLIAIPPESNTEYPNRLVFARPAML